jgi:hypothetical protein
MSDMNDFERALELELHRILDPMTAGSIPARRTTASGGSMKKLLGGAGAAIGVKILTGFVVAAAAATVAVAATETAVTGTVDPTVWGQKVKQQVDTCKDTLAAGQHGIGDCVSDFAKTHGDTVSDSATKKHGNGDTNGNGNANGNANASGKDKGKTHGQGVDKSEVAHTAAPSRP